MKESLDVDGSEGAASSRQTVGRIERVVHLMRHIAVLVAAVACGVTVGMIGYLAIRTVTGDDAASGRISGLLGFFSGCGILGYGMVWDEIARLRQPIWQRASRRPRAEAKLRTAELRFAFVFGMVGYLVLDGLDLPRFAIVIAVTFCALAGAFLGHDIKQRIGGIRQHPQD